MGIGEALEAIDALDDLLHDAKTIPLSDRVRVDPVTLAELVGRIRSHCEIALLGMRGSGTRAALDGLDDAVRDARPIRVYRGVSVDKKRIYKQVDQIREHLAEDLRPEGAPPPLPPEYDVPLGALEDLVLEGFTIPLSDQVRIDPITFRDVLERLRHAGMPPEARPILDRLTGAFEAAKGVPFSPHVRVDKEEMLAIIEALRTALRAPPP